MSKHNEWTPLAELLSNMITKYADTLNFEELSKISTVLEIQSEEKKHRKYPSI